MISKAIDVKVGVKPVCANWHISPWEGIVMKEISTEEAQSRFADYVTNLQKYISDRANVLKPQFIERGECISAEEDEALRSDLHNVDLFLPASFGAWGGGYTGVQLGQRYKKPVAAHVEVSANLRSRNLEGYVILDNNDLTDVIALLQVRKALKQTRMLLVSEAVLPKDVSDNVWDLEDVKARFGTEFHSISLTEFYNEMDRVLEAEDERKATEEISKRLMQQAQKVHMEQQYVVPSVALYKAAKNLMEKYGCNAFTIPCCDVIPNTMASERKAVPCLAHTLLKDEGIPSSCQYDVTALLSMMVLMYTSKKSCTMGNPSYDLNKNTLRLWHDVPGLKMEGLDRPDAPYELRNFTPSGWGANIRYDFARDIGKEVTVARFNPLVTKLFVAKGKIAGCDSFDKIGCTLVAEIEFPDMRKFLHTLGDFGAHLCMIYGDYSQELEQLGKLMGYEVVRGD